MRFVCFTLAFASRAAYAQHDGAGSSDNNPGTGSGYSDDAIMMGADSLLSDDEYKKQVIAASASPLGSASNPVRAQSPAGQYEYLCDLRCRDGSPPAFERVRAAGSGPYNTLMDLYLVDCGDGTSEKVSVFMDMYHNHVETSPIPGFTLAR